MRRPAGIGSRKRRSTQAVVAGLSEIAAALLVSTWELVPDLVTTLAATIGFGVFSYGVYLGWQLFYGREPDGPAS
jgi:hypothetical protein